MPVALDEPGRVVELGELVDGYPVRECSRQE
jgi:hypothetical protein